MYKLIFAGSVPFIVYTIYPLIKYSTYYKYPISSNRKSSCTMSNYNQCTNNVSESSKHNYLYKPTHLLGKNKANIHQRAYLLGKNRVNMYKPKKTSFNHLK